MERPVSSPWTTSDLIDLDYFLSLEPEEQGLNGRVDAAAADRAIYLSFTRHRPSTINRHELMRYWLDEKRTAREKGRPLPGEIFHETLALMKSLAAVTALFFGLVLAWSVLSYSGATPINIFTCLWVLVMPQLALLGLLGVSALMMSLKRKELFTNFYPLAVLVFRRLVERIKTAGQSSLSGGSRLKLIALLDLADRRHTLYGPALFRSLFMLPQMFGVWFNIGLLGAIGLKLAITDLAFGWQSTLFQEAATVHRLLDVFSLPWSWAVAAAHPSLAQIEGSRMILKDGMIHLATGDLVSWWPFLVYAVLCYGLAPRLLLLFWSGWQRRRSLSAVSFSTGACDRLIQRMRSPRMRTAGLTEKEGQPDPPPGPAPEEGPPLTTTLDSTAGAIVMVPAEIDHLFPDEALKSRLAEVLGLGLAGRLPSELDPAVDLPALRNLISRLIPPSHDMRLVFLTEAWQPPLRETLDWLTALRQATPPQTGLIVGLVGNPAGANRFTPPAPLDREVWTQAVAGLKDPFVRVETLGGLHG